MISFLTFLITQGHNRYKVREYYELKLRLSWFDKLPFLPPSLPSFLDNLQQLANVNVGVLLCEMMMEVIAEGMAALGLLA